MFYVYVLARPNGKPFYIGKGKDDRIIEHEREARRGHQCHKCNIIRKIWRDGGQVQRYTVFTTDDEQEAFAYECELIAFYGRKNLANLTDGGEGTVGHTLSAKTRARMAEVARARIFSIETRNKMSAAKRGQKQDAEHIRKRTSATKGRVVSTETRARLSAASRNISDETRAKRSAAIIAKTVDRKTCVHGHPWVAENIYIAPDGQHKHCRICTYEQHRAAKEKRKRLSGE